MAVITYEFDVAPHLRRQLMYRRQRTQPGKFGITMFDIGITRTEISTILTRGSKVPGVLICWWHSFPSFFSF
jgi:hypothetical protein